MLKDAELQELFERLAIPAAGRTRIRHIRDNPPSRAVRSNKMSGKTRYTPIKMPFVVEAEAVSTEYVALVEWDHDDETLEYYPQPEPLKIRYLAADRARQVTTLTTPDCLRITASRLVFVECKREEELERLSRKMPGRYGRNAQGRWQSPPAEAAAAELGCDFEIRSSKQNNWTLHENLELLKDYHVGEPVKIDPAVEQVLRDRISGAGWISAFELVHYEPAIPADQLYALIAARKIYFPITQLRLSDQERALVFRDETTYRARQAWMAMDSPPASAHALGIRFEPGAVFDWDGSAWKILNDGDERLTIKRLADGANKGAIADLGRDEMFGLVRAGRVTLHAPELVSPSHEDPTELLRRASTAHLQEAVWRLEVLENRADPARNPYAGRKRRARFYWASQFRDALARFGNGFVGLLPRRNGNRTPRASPATLDLAREIIAADWETIRRKRRSASWGRYRLLAQERGLDPISYVRFCQLVKERSGHRQLVTRIGEKAAYDQEAHYLELEWTTPRHGVRPWHITHIDHTPLPLKFVHSVLGTIVSTIWLTILLDANSRKVLAYYLSFDPPSYRSCMMVLRDCVRRHNRVPQILVCDQGPDFMSIYFETQLAGLDVSKRERRSGKPKAGSVCERIFNTSQSQFVKVLMGGTEVVENYFRRISPEVEPSRHAVWTLERFDEGFDRYLREVYHVNRHGGLGMSPDAAWALGLRSHGYRDHRAIPYDRAFIIASCPAVRKGKAKVTPAGIKINYRWYHCPEFQMPGVQGTQVEARYDPFNAGIAYVYIGKQWHECRSEFYALFATFTERAVWLATESLKLQDRTTGQHLGINAERLALFMLDQEKDEEVARQHRNDAESASHRQKLQQAGAAAIPPLASEPASSSSSRARALPASVDAGTQSPKSTRRSARILEDL